MDSYDFPEKHLYHKKKAIAIDRMLVKPKALRSVAYLDTKEAGDTISYLKRGYSAKNLWAINRNPAELALLTMKLERLGLPKVNTVGLRFDDALDRRVPDVDVIDFDGMQNLGNDLEFMLASIVAKRPRAVYGVTLLAGRESNAAGLWGMLIRTIPEASRYMRHRTIRTSFGQEVNPNHVTRLWILLNLFLTGDPIRITGGLRERAPMDIPEDHVFLTKEMILRDLKEFAHANEFRKECRIHITKLVWDVYMSTSRQPMLWCVCRVEPHKYLTRKEFLRNIKDTSCLCPPVCYSMA